MAPLLKLALEIAVAMAVAVRLIITSPIILYNILRKLQNDDDPHPPPSWYTRPTRLSTNRIDLAMRPCAAQSDSLFLSLPRELRDCIYEEALGGRRVRMDVAPDHPNRRHRVVSSAAPREEGDIRVDFDEMDPLCISLLRSCRQIYLESHSLVFSHNTFVFNSESVRTCIIAGIGDWAFPALRSVCIDLDGFPAERWFFDSPELISFDLLEQMKRLRRLDFQFNQISWKKDPPIARYDPREVQKSAWGQRVCELSSLEELRIIFAWNWKMVDMNVSDPRWNDLERGLLAQIAAKRRKNL
ncbi:hypothetical protein HMN09_01129000 [Mycena chlorophos]|uniref:DUF7730 domain-containing protein n=1 Tax=Mycena chlorophos TaxID=658473 RepID=A0A8H6SBS6_MYCCL|nr:hypothetical protein HMN09_01129000 [Mycena chlorophos]